MSTEAADNPDPRERTKVIETVRSGLAATPGLTAGLAWTVVIGVVAAIGKVTVPIIIQLAIDRGGLSAASGAGDERASVAGLVALGAVVVIATVALGVLARMQMIRRAEQAMADLRVKAFDHVHQLPMIDQSETRTGILITRVTGDVDSLSRFVDWGLFIWLVEPLVIVGVIAAMCFYSWPLGLATLVLLTPLFPLIAWSQDSMAAAFGGRRTAEGELLATFNESLAGSAVVRIHGLQSLIRGRLGRVAQDRYRAGLRANAYQSVVYVLGDVFTAATLTMILIAGVFWREALNLTSGEIIGLLLLATMMNGPLAELAETWSHAQEGVAGWRKVLTLLDQPTGDLEPTDGEALASGPLRVEFSDVSFRYTDRDDVVLDGVTAAIDARQTIAVVGASGSGKSTFCKLMCRLADPTSGRVLLNGTPLTDVAASSRHAAVRFVPQDGFLFDGTILDNIAVGVGGTLAPASREDVRAIIDRLGLSEWHDSLQHGLDTPVGEQGQNLSVGERQLVGLARAAVCDPGLLILDEATSSLDPRTERQLADAVTRLAADRTLVTIAHRMSTAQAANSVLVFDQGELVESGHHDDLVTRGGAYARLFEAWERELKQPLR